MNASDFDELPDRETISSAAEQIAHFAVETPLLSCAELDNVTGGRILLKAESLQRTGSFKFRGACNAISRIDRKVFPGGVVACSSGNHAQGVAEAARLFGHSAAIVMPSDAPETKLAGTRQRGAEVILYNREKEDRLAIARRVADERQAEFVAPYDNPHIIAGQGTAGLELVRQSEKMNLRPEIVLVPASGGGLLAGVALACKSCWPDVSLYSVEPEGFDDHARSFAAGSRRQNTHRAGSICDALMADMPGDLTFRITAPRVEGGLVVTDDEVRRAIAWAVRELKLVLEPGGAVALAALLAGRIPVRDRCVVALLSGGNIDPQLLRRILDT